MKTTVTAAALLFAFGSLSSLAMAAITCRQCDTSNGPTKGLDCNAKLLTDASPPQMTPCSDSTAVYCKMVVGITADRLQSTVTSSCALKTDTRPAGYVPTSPSSVYSCQRAAYPDGGVGYTCLCKNDVDATPCNNYDFPALQQAWTAMEQLQITGAGSGTAVMVMVDVAKAGTTFGSLQTLAPLVLMDIQSQTTKKIDASNSNIGSLTASPGQQSGGSSPASGSTTAASSNTTVSPAAAIGCHGTEVITTTLLCLFAVMLKLF